MYRFEKLEVYTIALDYVDLVYALTGKLEETAEKLSRKLQAMRKGLVQSAVDQVTLTTDHRRGFTIHVLHRRSSMVHRHYPCFRLTLSGLSCYFCVPKRE